MIIKMEGNLKEVLPLLSKTRMHFTSFLVVSSRIMVNILLNTSSSTNLNTSNNTTITTPSTLTSTLHSTKHRFSSHSHSLSKLQLLGKRNLKSQLSQSSVISLNSKLQSRKRRNPKYPLFSKLKKLKKKNQSLNQSEFLKRKNLKKMRKQVDLENQKILLHQCPTSLSHLHKIKSRVSQ